MKQGSDKTGTQRTRRGIAAAILALMVLSTGAILPFGPTASHMVAHADPAPGIALVEIRHGHANAYLLYSWADPASAVLIDTGLPQYADRLAKDLREAGVRPQDLDAILVTHAHLDHAGGARRLQALTGAPVVVGAGDDDVMRTAAPDDLCPTSPIAHLVRATVATQEDWSLEPDLLVEGDVDLAELSGIRGHILPLPGHTDGSLIVSVGDALFVGDLVRGSMVGRGPVRHFFMCDLSDNDADMAALLRAYPSDTRVFPGHFGGFLLSSLSRFSLSQKE